MGLLTVVKAHKAGIALTIGFISGAAALIETGRKSATKTPKIIEEHKKNVEDVRKAFMLDEREKSDLSTEEKKQYDKNLIKVYKHTAWELVKTYALALGFTVLSATCFLYSYHVIKAQYVALSAAYTALSDKFDNYRENVRLKYGDQADFDCMNDIGTQTLEIKNGKNKETFSIQDADITFTFDDTWDNFMKTDAGYNSAYVKNILEIAQDKLDGNSVYGITIEEIVDSFGSTKLREAELPLDWRIVGYEPGDEIEVELKYYEGKYVNYMGEIAAPPITLIFKNPHPVLTKIKPNDETAALLEDTYKGYMYDVRMKAEEEARLSMPDVKEEGEQYE